MYTCSKMKKLNILPFSVLILLLSAFPAFAQSVKIITLKDGTQIKGEVTRMQNDIYTVETESLGTLDIQASDIDSINADRTTAHAASSDTPMQMPPQNANEPMPSMQELQKKMMNDPEIIENAQTIAEDPRLMELMADPSVMNDLMSGDPARIENNAKLQELMNDPQMQELMIQMQEKFITPPQ